MGLTYTYIHIYSLVKFIGHNLKFEC